jgi:hypothetical protein
MRTLSVALNIAEGASKFSKADRKYFFRTARASAYKCVHGTPYTNSGITSFISIQVRAPFPRHGQSVVLRCDAVHAMHHKTPSN